jgi:hypothetical protein
MVELLARMREGLPAVLAEVSQRSGLPFEQRRVRVRLEDWSGDLRGAEADSRDRGRTEWCRGQRGGEALITLSVEDVLSGSYPWREALLHEGAHAAHRLTVGPERYLQVPRWLREGLAVWISGQEESWRFEAWNRGESELVLRYYGGALAMRALQERPGISLLAARWISGGPHLIPAELGGPDQGVATPLPTAALELLRQQVRELGAEPSLQRLVAARAEQEPERALVLAWEPRPEGPAAPNLLSLAGPLLIQAGRSAELLPQLELELSRCAGCNGLRDDLEALRLEASGGGCAEREAWLDLYTYSSARAPMVEALRSCPPGRSP